MALHRKKRNNVGQGGFHKRINTLGSKYEVVHRLRTIEGESFRLQSFANTFDHAASKQAMKFAYYSIRANLDIKKLTWKELRLCLIASALGGLDQALDYDGSNRGHFRFNDYDSKRVKGKHFKYYALRAATYQYELIEEAYSRHIAGQLTFAEKPVNFKNLEMPLSQKIEKYLAIHGPTSISSLTMVAQKTKDSVTEAIECNERVQLVDDIAKIIDKPSNGIRRDMERTHLGDILDLKQELRKINELVNQKEK